MRVAVFPCFRVRPVRARLRARSETTSNQFKWAAEFGLEMEEEDRPLVEFSRKLQHLLTQDKPLPLAYQFLSLYAGVEVRACLVSVHPAGQPSTACVCATSHRTALHRVMQNLLAELEPREVVDYETRLHEVGCVLAFFSARSSIGCG